MSSWARVACANKLTFEKLEHAAVDHEQGAADHWCACDFTRRNLPPFQQWPQLLLDRPEFQYPDYLNAAVELTDRNVEKGFGDRVALIGNGRQRTYKELTDWSNRLAHALVENYGVKPGNRVLIRSGNNPALVAAWLAATKAGAFDQLPDWLSFLRMQEAADPKDQRRTTSMLLRTLDQHV